MRVSQLHLSSSLCLAPSQLITLEGSALRSPSISSEILGTQATYVVDGALPPSIFIAYFINLVNVVYIARPEITVRKVGNAETQP